MTPFLYELAKEVYASHGRKLDALTFVFPNRRAALYFSKHLGTLLAKPVFTPRLVTIEDFISSFSPLKVPDKLALIHTLYEVYYEVVNASRMGDIQEMEMEPFDQFYFWGEMLLRDFDEVDKYMVNPGHLFRDLSNQKELDDAFDFLTDEQKEFLRSFWINFDLNDSANKAKFLKIWRLLPGVYDRYRAVLLSQGLAYEGMMHREVAEAFRSSPVVSGEDKDTNDALIRFVGFNALTAAEEVIISHFVSQGKATLHWDIDAYYINNNTQEAGKFFREYQRHPVLGTTFKKDIPANFSSVPRNQESKRGTHGSGKVNLYGAAQPVGQAKLMAQILQEKLSAGFDAEETLIVLPDEKLLMPVLHGVSGFVDKLNVTMGFPISSTPLYNLVELLVELQINRNGDEFNHRQVLALLGHPYVIAADAVVANTKRKAILQQNWINISNSFLGTAVDLHRLIFREISSSDAVKFSSTAVIGYLKNIITEIGGLTSISEFDKEYAFHFVRLLNRMEDILYKHDAEDPVIPVAITLKERQALEKNILKSFMRLFRQLIRAEKIPFTGEPLKGLQVMGVLETRNLDFKHVFILSLNEGAFPSFSSKGSYIPFNIRRAYALPTPEHQDAMYAYLFYRVLQRAENIFLFYNSETDVLGQGEMSRYLQQLLYESNLKIERHVLHNPIQPLDAGPIKVEKDAQVFQELARHCVGHRQVKELTPTALNDYIECRLKFYFRHIARIREPREVEEELDARVLGNFLHKVMELFYQGVINAKGSNVVEVEDFRHYEKKVELIIDKVFIESYKLDPAKKVVYEGQRLVVKEIVKRFVDRIVEIDMGYAPFTLEALEQRGLTFTIPLDAEGHPEVMIGGIVDRADRKDDTIRVIDYKTGRDELTFGDVRSLFYHEGKRNKAAFQTLLYALLYKKNRVHSDHVRLIPGLMNRVNLFDDDFTFGLRSGNNFLRDATPLFPEFEAELKKLLEELFDPAIPFDQTQDTETCRICPYHHICYR